MKKTVFLSLCVFTVIAQAQVSDTIGKKKKFNQHELGINLLPPLLFVSGATGVQPKFLNTTYRYLKNEKHAFRVTTGINVYNTGGHPSFMNDMVSHSNDLTIIKTTSNRSPINIMTGIGYERILGKRKLKHVVGFDLNYNYVSRKTIIDYYGFKDSIVNGINYMEFVPIDTGKTVIHKYYNKFGITPFYSVRYELSPKWTLTASTRFNFQYSRLSYPGYPKISSFDFNTSGLLSELSLFYRF